MRITVGCMERVLEQGRQWAAGEERNAPAVADVAADAGDKAIVALPNKIRIGLAQIVDRVQASDRDSQSKTRAKSPIRANPVKFTFRHCCASICRRRVPSTASRARSPSLRCVA